MRILYIWRMHLAHYTIHLANALSCAKSYTFGECTIILYIWRMHYNALSLTECCLLLLRLKGVLFVTVPLRICVAYVQHSQKLQRGHGLEGRDDSWLSRLIRDWSHLLTMCTQGNTYLCGLSFPGVKSEACPLWAHKHTNSDCLEGVPTNASRVYMHSNPGFWIFFDFWLTDFLGQWYSYEFWLSWGSAHKLIAKACV